MHLALSRYKISLHSSTKPQSSMHYLTVLFQIYQNNDWTIRWWKDCPINPATQHIILKIVGFLEIVAYNNFMCFYEIYASYGKYLSAKARLGIYVYEKLISSFLGRAKVSYLCLPSPVKYVTQCRISS